MTSNDLAFSFTGQKELSGTVVPPTNGTLIAIQVETDAVITSCVWAPGYDAPVWNSRTLKAGQTYYGRWLRLVVASGTGIVHFV